MLKNFDRLKVFYFVYSLKSIAAASKTLLVSQSAVSQSVIKLEKEIKSPLFTRLHKQLVPTTAGNYLFEIINPFMSDLDMLLREIAKAREYPFGELRVGAPLDFGRVYIPLIVASFRELFPEVTFTLTLETSEKLLPQLKEGKIDLILADEFFTKVSFIGNLDFFLFEPIVEEEIILACSKQYFDRYIKNDISFKNLSTQNFISYTKENQVIKQWFKHHFTKSAGHVRNILIVDSHGAIISAIRNHAGMGVIGSHYVKKELQNNEIVAIKVSKKEIINTISLVQLQDKIPNITEKKFIKFLVEKLKLIVSKEHWAL
jgi:DNA-binding transcriptional LysR family regulator